MKEQEINITSNYQSGGITKTGDSHLFWICVSLFASVLGCLDSRG